SPGMAAKATDARSIRALAKSRFSLTGCSRYASTLSALIPFSMIDPPPFRARHPASLEGWETRQDRNLGYSAIRGNVTLPIAPAKISLDHYGTTSDCHRRRIRGSQSRQGPGPLRKSQGHGTRSQEPPSLPALA